MKTSDFFDNLNVFFGGDEDVVEDPDELESSSQIYSYAYKNDRGEVHEIRIFNPEYREILVIDRNGKIETISIEDV